LKLHNFTDLKLVRKQHWNFNEFNFYINTLLTGSVSPDEKNCALDLENITRPSAPGHSFSHPDLAAGK
jgi:hypothetical protein